MADRLGHSFASPIRHESVGILLFLFVAAYLVGFCNYVLEDSLSLSSGIPAFLAPVHAFVYVTPALSLTMNSSPSCAIRYLPAIVVLLNRKYNPQRPQIVVRKSSERWRTVLDCPSRISSALKSGAVVQKSILLAAIQKEIQRHDFSYFADEPPSVEQGGKGVVVSGCPACRKRINTMGQFLDPLTNNVMPVAAANRS